jgi:hypothetical protein
LAIPWESFFIGGCRVGNRADDPGLLSGSAFYGEGPADGCGPVAHYGQPHAFMQVGWESITIVFDRNGHAGRPAFAVNIDLGRIGMS